MKMKVFAALGVFGFFTVWWFGKQHDDAELFVAFHSLPARSTIDRCAYEIRSRGNAFDIEYFKDFARPANEHVAGLHPWRAFRSQPLRFEADIWRDLNGARGSDGGNENDLTSD